MLISNTFIKLAHKQNIYKHSGIKLQLHYVSDPYNDTWKKKKSNPQLTTKPLLQALNDLSTKYPEDQRLFLLGADIDFYLLC